MKEIYLFSQLSRLHHRYYSYTDCDVLMLLPNYDSCLKLSIKFHIHLLSIVVLNQQRTIVNRVDSLETHYNMNIIIVM